MEISVCLPIYNTFAHDLVTDLQAEIFQKNFSDKIEIILIDDASEDKYRKANSVLEGITYHQLEKNVGRSKIRNLFLNFAKGTFLLFMDGDSLIPPSGKNQFLSNYLKAINEQTNCICGGRVYPKLAQIKGIELNYYYGIKIESKSAAERRKNPNVSFMTNNFLLRKTLFETVHFDENLTQYGHEDTLFGLELLARKIFIEHIENPVLNGKIETNAVFLHKSELAVENLAYIYKNYDKKALLEQHIRLLRWYKKFNYFPMRTFLKIIFSLIKIQLKRTLINGKGNLKLFNFYKLGLFFRFAK